MKNEKTQGKKVVVLARDFSVGDGVSIKMLTDKGFDVEIHEQTGTTNDEETIEWCKDADAIICATTLINENVLSHLPNLKFISRRGVGMDTVDMDAVKRHNIKIERTVGAVESGVAELVIAYILMYGRQIIQMNENMKQGEWNRIFAPGVRTRTLGLVGYGRIGKEIAKRASAFNMKIIYYNRHPQTDNVYGAEYVEMDELLRQSDYISVNVPLTDETERMIGKNEFNQMKNSVFFINISRGKVVDTQALYDALKSGKIAGAGIDVYDYEPCTDSILRECDNVILTPHIGPYTETDFIGVNNMASQHIIDYFKSN